LVDGIISHPPPDKNILFLIQFKFKEKAKLDGEDQLKGLKVDFKNENVEQLNELMIPIVIIDQKSLEEFFSPLI
jgi:hypothetical protein